jgi:putative polyhydroxyalkanoate system protein
MAKITVEQPHQLSPEEAKSRLDGFLQRMSSRMGGSYKWSSPTEATIDHSMAKATVRIEPSRVVVNVDGGLALSLVKGKTEQRVKQELEKALAQAPTVA